MCDFLGNELHVGDKVVYLNHWKTSSHYSKTVIKGFTPQRVWVEKYGHVKPEKLIKYED